MLGKLAIEQRKLSRKKKGSSNWNRQRIRVAKIQEKVANQKMAHNEDISIFFINPSFRFDCLREEGEWHEKENYNYNYYFIIYSFVDGNWWRIYPKG